MSSIAQATTIDELVQNNSILLVFLKLRGGVQQMELDRADAIELVAQIEQLQTRRFPGARGEMPHVLDDVVIRPGSDDLNVALNCRLDLLGG